jgi:hypothetical protein
MRWCVVAAVVNVYGGGGREGSISRWKDCVSKLSLKRRRGDEGGGGT